MIKRHEVPDFMGYLMPRLTAFALTIIALALFLKYTGCN